VPTQGSATYTGSGIRGSSVADATFNVDFAAKTIKGNVSGDSAFGSAIAMQGNIEGGGFKGSAQTGSQTGTFVGHFNGPQAEELGGIAQFADAKMDAAFGATAQK
ncbi:transferrin-binding protein-like solute binding protein, partial [Winslowiella iniecta]